MLSQERLIFLHGLDSSSQGYKARLLRRLFPTIHTPDFAGPLEQRMEQLAGLLGNEIGWTMIGSSFGGLMATLWVARNPASLQRLILFAPALVPPFFKGQITAPIATPTIIYHGRHDTVVPLEPVRALAERVFVNLTFHAVDDDHLLRTTVDLIDWEAL